MSKVREKIKLTSYDELLKVEITDGLKEIDVDKLHDFSNHPFKVSDPLVQALRSPRQQWVQPLL